MRNTRARKLVEHLPAGFEAALIGTEENRFYFLDFEAGDAGTLLILPDKMVYIIDARYIETARRDVRGAEVLLEEDVYAQLAGILRAEGVKKVYLEEKVPIALWHMLQKKIPDVEYDIGNTLSKEIAALRLVKDDEELARMHKAQALTDDCFAHILPFIKEGAREIDLALEMEQYMRRQGAEGIAFDTICVAGPNTSLPHGVPGDYRIQKGDFLTMDFGCKVQGYCSDMTRTVALGEPGKEKRKVYDTVLQAHLAGIEAAKAGRTGVEVDKAARDIIDAAGYKGCFGHGLGHSLGIEVHEDPRFSPKGKAVVPAGAMMTVEPGIYLAGRFGCRIEDMGRVTEAGFESFAQSPKEMMIL